MPKENYNVTIKIKQDIFVENVLNPEEAERQAVNHVSELLIHGIRPYSMITTVKSAETNNKVHVEQLEEIQKTSLQLASIFNKEELKLLAKDLEFYTGE